MHAKVATDAVESCRSQDGPDPCVPSDSARSELTARLHPVASARSQPTDERWSLSAREPRQEQQPYTCTSYVAVVILTLSSSTWLLAAPRRPQPRGAVPSCREGGRRGTARACSLGVSGRWSSWLAWRRPSILTKSVQRRTIYKSHMQDCQAPKSLVGLPGTQ